MILSYLLYKNVAREFGHFLHKDNASDVLIWVNRTLFLVRTHKNSRGWRLVTKK